MKYKKNTLLYLLLLLSILSCKREKALEPEISCDSKVNAGQIDSTLNVYDLDSALFTKSFNNVYSSPFTATMVFDSVNNSLFKLYAWHNNASEGCVIESLDNNIQIACDMVRPNKLYVFKLNDSICKMQLWSSVSGFYFFSSDVVNYGSPYEVENFNNQYLAIRKIGVDTLYGWIKLSYFNSESQFNRSTHVTFSTYAMQK